jgi:hypothetical protein
MCAQRSLANTLFIGKQLRVGRHLFIYRYPTLPDWQCRFEPPNQRQARRPGSFVGRRQAQVQMYVTSSNSCSGCTATVGAKNIPKMGSINPSTSQVGTSTSTGIRLPWDGSLVLDFVFASAGPHGNQVVATNKFGRTRPARPNPPALHARSRFERPRPGQMGRLHNQRRS